jgi:aspartate racemase
LKEKLIGILAGMGPQSTGPFINAVIRQCQIQYGAKNDIDYPHMMIYSLPTPFYMDRRIDHAAMKETICGGLKRLEAAGVDFIAIPCNTAHIYYDELRRSVDVPILNIVDETLRSIPESSKKIALFATRPTIESKLYQKRIERVGLALVSKDEWQLEVDRLLEAIKLSADSSTLNKMWKRLVLETITSGVDTVLLGCTDLNVVNNFTPVGIATLDTMECLARAVVKRYTAVG